ncbi:MAG: hypothetical protein KDC90_02195, partial [Ignavibacteriae bacterium]|nr:hypothetical protein [Ignavibacteriota bacterium]
MSNNIKTNYFKSLKFKLSAPIFLGSVIITLAVSLFSYYSISTDLDENVQKNFTVFEKMFSDQIKAKENDVIMTMQMMLNNDTLVSKFESGDRDGLKNMLLDLYVNKLQKEHDVVQLQFHT